MNRESIYTVPYSKVSYGSRIVIYGAGKMGQNIYQNMKYSDRLKIVAVLDGKAGSLLGILPNIPVLEPQKVLELEYDYIFIAVESEETASDIKNKLLQYGVENQKIIWLGDSQDISDVVTNELHKFVVRALSSEKRRFFIFLLPEHGNIGDYAIGYAEQKFLNKYFSRCEVYGVTTDEWIKAKDFFMNCINKEDVICINGGGSFGDLWGEEIVYVYKDIIESFPDNQKIFFPNNLTYRKAPSPENKVFVADIQWLNKQQNLHFCLRERKSFELLSKYVHNCYLFPDMVLSLEYPRSEFNSHRKILLCIRDDREKVFKEDKYLEELLLKNGFDCDKFDLHTNRYISQDMGRMLVDYVVQKFQGYDCVITDRLHGMILSVISNVPCIALDNYTHKISGVYEWIKDMDCAVLIEESEIKNIVEIIRKVCSNKKMTDDYHPQAGWFDDMAEKLHEILDTQ